MMVKLYLERLANDTPHDAPPYTPGATNATIEPKGIELLIVEARVTVLTRLARPRNDASGAIGSKPVTFGASEPDRKSVV